MSPLKRARRCWRRYSIAPFLCPCFACRRHQVELYDRGGYLALKRAREGG